MTEKLYTKVYKNLNTHVEDEIFIDGDETAIKKQNNQNLKKSTQTVSPAKKPIQRVEPYQAELPNKNMTQSADPVVKKPQKIIYSEKNYPGLIQYKPAEIYQIL